MIFRCSLLLIVALRVKKRTFREMWIQQINAGTRQHGLPYNRFISGLDRANIKLNRKMLSELAINEPYSFKAVVSHVKNFITPPRGPGQV